MLRDELCQHVPWHHSQEEGGVPGPGQDEGEGWKGTAQNGAGWEPKTKCVSQCAPGGFLLQRKTASSENSHTARTLLGLLS